MFHAAINLNITYLFSIMKILKIPFHALTLCPSHIAAFRTAQTKKAYLYIFHTKNTLGQDLSVYSDVTNKLVKCYYLTLYRGISVAWNNLQRNTPSGIFLEDKIIIRSSVVINTLLKY